MTNQLQKGDIVIRAYAHDPEEWGIIIDLETVVVDPQDQSCPPNPSEYLDEYLIEYVYATVLWPGYTTQEVDYELWTPQEAIDYAVKYFEAKT